MNSESLGADAYVHRAFQTYAALGLMLARVAISHRDQYCLYTEAGEVAGEPAGALWYRSADAAAMPVVGDWAAARIAGPGQAIVEAVLPRRSCFERRAAGKREVRQPIAANIDFVFLVCGLDGDFNLRRLERYLTLAAESGVAPVIVLSKADRCEDAAARERETAAVAGSVPVVALSAPADGGVEPLTAFLAAARTVALLGSSGVGKSTIVNRLLGGECFRTGAVRESDSRGRHTTTHRELAPLPGVVRSSIRRACANCSFGRGREAWMKSSMRFQRWPRSAALAIALMRGNPAAPCRARWRKRNLARPVGELAQTSGRGAAA